MQSKKKNINKVQPMDSLGEKSPNELTKERLEIIKNIFKLYQEIYSCDGLLSELQKIEKINEELSFENIKQGVGNVAQKLIGTAKGAIDTIMTNPKIPQSIKDTLKQYQDKLQNQDNTNKTPTTQDKINQQNKTPEQDKKEKENLINTIRQQLLQKAQSSSKSLNQMWTNVQKNVPSLKGKSFDQVVSMFKNGEITKEDFTSIPTRT